MVCLLDTQRDCWSCSWCYKSSPWALWGYHTWISRTKSEVWSENHFFILTMILHFFFCWKHLVSEFEQSLLPCLLTQLDFWIVRNISILWDTLCRCPDPGGRIPTSKCRVFPRPRWWCKRQHSNTRFILVPAAGPYVQQRGCARALYYLAPWGLVVGGTSEAREGGSHVSARSVGWWWISSRSVWASP